MSASWPTAVATDANLYLAVNELQTNLSSGINSAVTTITLNSTTSFPTVGLVLIDNEVIKYTGVSGSNLTGCTRGFDGTTAASHLAAAVVSFAIMAAHHNVLKDEIEAIETTLSNLVGLSATLPLTVSLPVKTDSSGHLTAATITNADIASSAAIALSKLAALGTAKALQSNSSTGAIEVSSVTNTELGYLSGVTSALQTQLNAKQATLTAGQLPGTATNDSASAGNVGQYIESLPGTTSVPSSTHYGDLTSITLTAGDWDVTAIAEFTLNTATGWTKTEIGISTTTGDSSSGLSFGINAAEGAAPTSNNDMVLTIPSYRMSVSGSTIVYFKFRGVFSGGTPQAFQGRLSARRMR